LDGVLSGKVISGTGGSFHRNLHSVIQKSLPPSFAPLIAAVMQTTILMAFKAEKETET